MPSSPVAAPFGRILRGHRRRLDLTLREVAEESGCSLSYLSKLESGQVLPKRKALLSKMADVLRLDAGERKTLERAAFYAEGSLPLGIDTRRYEIVHRIVSLPKLSEKALNSIEELLLVEER